MGADRKSASSRRKRSGGVLEDHKKVGNRLKSPWLTEFNFQFISYVDEVIPEIVLLALFNDSHGYRRGAELALSLSTALLSLGDEAAPLLSVLGGLSPAEFAKIKDELGDNLSDVQVAAAPLINLLPEHPLADLNVPQLSEDEAVTRLKTCVEGLYDRSSTPACAALANLYYAQACNGKIRIAQNVRRPDLEAIITRPQSDEALHASSAVRMHAQMVVAYRGEENPSEWPGLFWHRCYLRSDCDTDYD